MMIGNLSFASTKAYLRCSGKGFNLISDGYSCEGSILVERINATTSSWVAICLDIENCSLTSSLRSFVKGCLLIMLGSAS